VGEVYGTIYDNPDWAAFPKRLTFLIAPDGTLAKIYEVSDVQAHAQEVLDEIQSRV
jgi:peroxiredoxin